MTDHGLIGVADAAVFLTRLVRFDPNAPVRLRRVEPEPAGGPRTALWGRLPWDVLVTRTVAGPGPGDSTVSAANLLASLHRGSDALPNLADQRWRWPLPPSTGRVVEHVPGEEVLRIARAAASTLRTAARTGLGDGRPLGERALRDALLDHVAIVVTSDPPEVRVEVAQRLVQAVVRMGFLVVPADSSLTEVEIRMAAGWVGVAAASGTAWRRNADPLLLWPANTPPNGR